MSPVIEYSIMRIERSINPVTDFCTHTKIHIQILPTIHSTQQHRLSLQFHRHHLQTSPPLPPSPPKRIRHHPQTRTGSSSPNSLPSPIDSPKSPLTAHFVQPLKAEMILPLPSQRRRGPFPARHQHIHRLLHTRQMIAHGALVCLSELPPRVSGAGEDARG